MSNLIKTLERLGIKNRQLGEGDPILAENQERWNLEHSAQELLGMCIHPSKPNDLVGSFAVFRRTKGKSPKLSLEIHTDDSKLVPVTHSVGEKVTLLPALAAYPKRKVWDITVISTAHIPKHAAFRGRMRRHQENANNDAHRELFTRIENHWAPADARAGVVRNLYVIAPTKDVVPTISDLKRGSGGRVVKFTEAGDIVNSLIYRRPPRFRSLEPDKNETIYHLEEYAAPSEDPVEGPDYLDVDGTLFAFFRGGVVDSETFPQLARMPVDILLRLEWREGSNKLFVTPLLRASGKRARLDSLREDLDDMGGWKLIRTIPMAPVTQMEAFQAFLPGNRPLPPKFGRREVKGWSNLDPEKALLGLPHQLTKSVSPVGDPQADFIAGFVTGVGYTMQPGPGILVTSRSEGGKSTIVALLANQREPKTFWVDITADRRGSPPYWTWLFGGVTWYVDAPDAEEVFQSETGHKGSSEQIDQLRTELHEHDSMWVDLILQRMLQNSIAKRKWLYYPFCMHPINNSGRYLDIADMFLDRLPKITAEWLALTGQSFGVVVNDFSHLLSVQTSGSDWQKKLAVSVGNNAVWYNNHGSNAGAGSFTLITHHERDPDTLLKREVLSTFAHLLRGATDQSEPTYEFDLVVPQSITPAFTGEVEAKLNLRISDDDLLDLVDRLTPSFGKEFMEQIYQPHEILKRPEFSFTVFNNNGNRLGRRERTHGRSQE